MCKFHITVPKGVGCFTEHCGNLEPKAVGILSEPPVDIGKTKKKSSPFSFVQPCEFGRFYASRNSLFERGNSPGG